MHSQKFSLLLALLSLSACTYTNAQDNLLANPSFDDKPTDCNTTPSWTQVNSSNPFSICPQQSWYYVSPPYALILSGSGWSGAQQTVALNQQTPDTLNLTAWVWLASCSDQSCYSSIGYFGVQFSITFQDGTSTAYGFPFPIGASTTNFAPYTYLYTPPQPITSLVLQVLLDGNGQALAIWDNFSLQIALSPSTSTSTSTSSSTSASTPTPSSNNHELPDQQQTGGSGGPVPTQNLTGGTNSVVPYLGLLVISVFAVFTML